jgi:hypothetical protein
MPTRNLHHARCVRLSGRAGSLRLDEPNGGTTKLPLGREGERMDQACAPDEIRQPEATGLRPLLSRGEASVTVKRLDETGRLPVVKG